MATGYLAIRPFYAPTALAHCYVCSRRLAITVTGRQAEFGSFAPNQVTEDASINYTLTCSKPRGICAIEKDSRFAVHWVWLVPATSNLRDGLNRSSPRLSEWLGNLRTHLCCAYASCHGGWHNRTSGTTLQFGSYFRSSLSLLCFGQSESENSSPRVGMHAIRSRQRHQYLHILPYL